MDTSFKMRRDLPYFVRLPRWAFTVCLVVLFIIAFHAEETVGKTSKADKDFTGLEQPAQKSLSDGSTFLMDQEVRVSPVQNSVRY